MSVLVNLGLGTLKGLDDLARERHEKNLQEAEANAKEAEQAFELKKIGIQSQATISAAEAAANIRAAADLQKATVTGQLDVIKTLLSKGATVSPDILEAAGLPRDAVLNMPDGSQELNQELVNTLVGKGVVPPPGLVTAAGFDASIVQQAATAVNEASKDYLTYGMGDNKLSVVQEAVMGLKADDPTAIAKTFFNSWERHLTQGENFNDALEFFTKKENATLLQTLSGEVRGNANTLVTQLEALKGGATQPVNIAPVDIANTYPNAAKLFDNLGLRTDIVEDILIPQKAKEMKADIDIEYDEETQDIVFLYSQTASQTDPQFVPIVMNKETLVRGERLAKATGYKNFQNMLLRNSFRTMDAGESDMSPQQLARHQNRRILAAVEMEERGYGDLFRDSTTALTNPELVKDFFQYLNTTFTRRGSNHFNEQEALEAVSFLYGKPVDFFEMAAASRYGTPANFQLKPGMSGEAMAFEITNIEKNDFNEGYKATMDSLAMLDELMKLEKDLAKQVGSGFVRDAFATAARLKIQVESIGKAAKGFFTDNASGEDAIFTNLAENTSLGDLEAVVNKLNAEGATDINLQNLSAADSLRLALAARMARAIDPSGRLSNQDFEIQLRRLGQSNLSSPAEIQASLRQVKKDFERDLEAKHLLYRMYNDRTELTEAKAKKAIAYMGMRDLQALAYGAKAPVGGQQAQDGTVDMPTTTAVQTVNIGTEEAPISAEFHKPEGGGMGSWVIVDRENNTARKVKPEEVAKILAATTSKLADEG
jgi:hypothetical protein